MSFVPDWESFFQRIAEISTEKDIQGSLSMGQLDELQNMLARLQVVLAGGNQENVTNAYDAAQRIYKIMGRGLGDEDSEYETTTCQYCGASFTGTNDEVSAWEEKHMALEKERYTSN